MIPLATVRPKRSRHSASPYFCGAQETRHRIRESDKCITFIAGAAYLVDWHANTPETDRNCADLSSLQSVNDHSCTIPLATHPGAKRFGNGQQREITVRTRLVTDCIEDGVMESGAFNDPIDLGYPHPMR